MQIDIWSDVVCPFCYIGKRKLELALAESSIAADIVWHSFELNPDAPPTYGIPLSRLLADKYGMGEARALEVLAHEEEEARKVGLDFRWQIAKPGNTFNAHRLIHLGKSVGIGDKVNERFLRGYFTEGQEIGDPAVLRTMAVEAGLDPVAAHEVLAGHRHPRRPFLHLRWRGGGVRRPTGRTVRRGPQGPASRRAGGGRSLRRRGMRSAALDAHDAACGFVPPWLVPRVADQQRHRCIHCHQHPPCRVQAPIAAQIP